MRKSVHILVVLLMISISGAGAVLAQDDPEALVGQLPDELQVLYENATDNIQPSAYDDFEPVEQPWKWCHSESYQGNPWRVAVTTELERLADIYQEEGLISEFVMLDANLDVDLQIEHIYQFIDEGCSIITTFAGSPSRLNDAIADAFAAGIPVITASGSVTSPYAINVDSNYYRWGYDMAEGIANVLGGEGNVVLVEGLAGHPITLTERQGADDAFANYPDITIVASVNGDWTPDVTKSALRDVLQLTQVPIDAVWTTGSESRFVAEVFAELGLPTSLITASISGDALAYWDENSDEFNFYGHAVLPGWTAQTLFRVGVRILEGQKPKLNTLMMPLPEVTQEDLPDWFESCMTLDDLIFPVPPTDPMPEELMNEYFVDGEAIPFYDYEAVPAPCGS